MRKRTFKNFIALLASSCLAMNMGITAVTTYAAETPPSTKGTVTVTVYDEETGELFLEDGDFSIIGGGKGAGEGAGGAIYVGGWNTSEQNPYIKTEIANTSDGWSYVIQYTGRDYDGFSYYIDYDKAEPRFDFSDGLEQNVEIYMKKFYWDTETDDKKEFKEDSLSISEEIKDEFRVYETYSDEFTKPERRLVKDFKSIMRLYNVPVRFAFTEFSNIDDILSSNEMLGWYYVVEYEDGALKFYNEQLDEMESTRYAVIEGKETLLPFIDIPDKAFETFKNPDIIKQYISPEAEIENVYYLSGETSMMGTAIYYRTSVGDYVYYYYPTIGETLFPVNDFCEYQQAITDYYAEYPESGGGIDIPNVWDLTNYTIENKTTTTPEDIAGDANCDGTVDLADAVLIMQYYSNPDIYGIEGSAPTRMTLQGMKNADVEGNGNGVTNMDALEIQLYLLGAIKEFSR